MAASRSPDSRTLVLVGAGGHARVVAESATESGWRLAGFIDDRPRASLGDQASRLGGLSCLEHEELVRHHPVVLARGDLRLRRDLIPRLHEPIATIVHPSAVVSSSAELGPGVFVGPRAVVNPGAHIGAHAIINTSAIVEHDCRIGENTHLAPGVVLGGNVSIESDTLVGLNASVIPGVRIGSRVTIGAGAAVVHDVADGELIIGVPGAVRSDG